MEYEENHNSAATATSTSNSSPQTQSVMAKKQKKIKNAGEKPSHPPKSEMINNAIKSLKGHGASSWQAIQIKKTM